MVEQAELGLADLDGAAWVRLDGGTFQMGSENRRDDVRPMHEVRLSPYRMSRFPVTNGQYAAYVQATGAPAPEHWAGGEMPADQVDHPVTYVSWAEAHAFCVWLTCQVGSADGGVHLPTEAQWEFAARGSERREYPWGGEPPTPERANYQESASEGTTAVDAHPLGATPEGVFDMAGNVRHWCADRFSLYADAPQEDPTGPVEGQERTLRGGAYLDAAGTLRGSYRFNIDPDSRFGFVGFRVAWS